MSLTALGAPGVSFEVPVLPPALRGVRRDVAAFAGVAPRGPARLPQLELPAGADLATYLAGGPVSRSVAVAVDSWQDYRSRFGGFEGAGRLPYAVAAYFAQGGQRAYVVRIVHDYGDPVADAGGRAAGALAVPGPVSAVPSVAVTSRSGAAIRVHARDEGVWGDRLRADVSWRVRPVPVTEATTGQVTVPVAEWVPVGSLLRLTLPDGHQVLRYVDDSVRVLRPDRPGADRVVSLEAPLADPPVAADVVTAVLDVVDDDPTLRRTERLDQLGLRSDHPRWLARVLVDESTLLWPDATWAGGALDLTDPALPALTVLGDGDSRHLTGGSDRSADIVPDDFFDLQWVPGDERPGAGVHCLAEVEEVGLLAAPDLYSPSSLVPVAAPPDPPDAAGPVFAECVPHVEPPPPVEIVPELAGLRLDPTVAADLAVITRWQAALVDLAEQRRDLTVLLDVPPGLGARRTLAWRGDLGVRATDSPFAACYHPWLDVARPDDDRDGLISVNPSAFAAGIISARERREGVHVGPANTIADGAVRVGEAVAAPLHDTLHDAGINVLRPERDGVRLTGARTLSRDSDLCHLSVVRLLTVVRLTLERRLSWLVFEPNGEQTWRRVTRVVGGYLDELHRAGALAGAKPSDGYFVRCDRTTMTQNDLDAGRLVAEVGIAPVLPLEYLVLRLSVATEVLVQLERRHG